jgi:glutaminyl-peptide cyclotransferase
MTRPGGCANPEPRRRPGLLLAAAAVLAAALMLDQASGAVQPDEPPAAAVPRFDGERSFKYLQAQVSAGPRVPNTRSHTAVRDWIAQGLRQMGASVLRQDFTAAAGASPLRMSNIIARWPGTGSGPGVLLCAHWDTRPTADFEADPARRRRPIPGANDGASGVAVLLEISRAFRQVPPPVPVMMVFFDGEDYGPGPERMFLGSRHFASHLPSDVPRRGVLLDMVGDRDLVLPREAHSVAGAPEVVEELYGVAERLGYARQFPRTRGATIVDDHVLLLRRGLKVIDLIDFAYGPAHTWWHTLADTPDKCSAESLKTVGSVVLEWVYTRK